MASSPRSETRGDRGCLERLAERLLVADGALGTMLHAKGLTPEEPPELWNLTRPDAVLEIHEAYLAVGCDLIETNTFGANRLRLKARGLDGQVAAINAAAARLAGRAASGSHLVAGALGPTGIFRGGRHSGSQAEIVSAFAEQAAYLVQGGVDLILIETMTHLAEARLALRAAGESTPLPVAVSLVFIEKGEDLLTVDGASPEEAVRELSTAHILGWNCMDPERGAEVLRQMREATVVPLIAQPHAGLPQQQGNACVYPLTPDDLARHVPPLLVSQPAILGGCCGTTPAHLAAMMRSIPRPHRSLARKKSS